MAEQVEIRIHLGLTQEEARGYADYIMPPGKRGRVKLALNPPPVARALAFIATVLRSLES